MKMYLATITEVLSLSLFMSFKIFNFEQIKIIVGEPEIKKLEKSGRKVAEF